jgi:chromosome partitioning protein
MKTLVLANHQAAVGKSTVSAMLVHHLARQGRRVLAIDLDHPGALGRSLRRSEQVVAVPLADDALTGSTPPHLPVADGRSIVLIDGARRWRGLARQPRRGDDFIGNLQDLMAIVRRRFDVCVIDTPARPGVRLLAALACADLVLVPSPLDPASIGRVGYLFWHARCGIYKVQASFNPRLQVLGLLPTMVHAEGGCQDDRPHIARLAADHQGLLIRVGDRLNTDRIRSACGPASEFAYVPLRAEIAQTLASGQMPWAVSATAARAVWNEMRPSIEALSAHLAADRAGAEVRP